jgi:hypothetical protein
MKYSVLFIILFLSQVGISQAEKTGAIRGVVVDHQSQFPIPGVTIMLVNSDPVMGVATDVDGHFRLEDVPVGRQALKVTFIGYEPQYVSNLQVNSGKDLEANIFLVESIIQLEGAEIIAEENKHEALNEMSTVSSRSFSVEEARRYSGSLLDPARMAQNYAGVSNASDDRNDIIIRGNSPTGVLWRMDGIDIPSPNHFGTLGTTGGPVSILNINNLANSDFMTSAFPAEYGNALAGVFDLRLRNGNSHNYEFLGQMGFNGLELGAEGPMKITKNSSFLINYRYSTLGIFKALGIDFGTGASVPEYQDITFKLDIPTDKLGRFSVFGVGGLSYVEFKGSDANESALYSEDSEDSEFGSDTGWLGFSHQYFFNEKTKSKLVVAASYVGIEGWVDSLSTDDGSPHRTFGLNNKQVKYSANFSVNSKLNVKNTVKAGVVFDRYDFTVEDSVLWQPDIFFHTSDFEGTADLAQAYVSWQARFGELTTLNAGIHGQYFIFNNSSSIEPRLGLRYTFRPDQSLNLGVGLHSQLQPITVYFREDRLDDGSSELKNDELGMNKTWHAVIGYDNSLSRNFRIKIEAYYQHLFNIAVDRESSSFSMLNTGVDFGIPSRGDLYNGGSGTNYGLEFTAERFLADNFYILSTLSLFQSVYEGSDRVERNTAFNGQYVFNILGGKEWPVGKQNTISLDSKFTIAGGRWYTPIDLEASELEGQEVRFDDLAFSEQYAPYLRWDVKLAFQSNGKKISQQWAVDVRNVTNNKNIFLEQYNSRTNEIQTRYQIGLFPVVLWTIYF